MRAGWTLPAALLCACLSACGGTSAPPPAPAPAAPPTTAGLPAVTLLEGEEAPDFELAADDGTLVRLSDHRGRDTVALYFYPKDETPGCTKQACAYRDAADSFAARGIVRYGVSVDGVASHAAFRAAHRLDFRLLADPGGVVAGHYGVRGGNGRARRVTFLVGADGVIRRILRDVDPASDPARVLEALGG